MKVRLIRFRGKEYLLCADGTKMVANDSVLRRLFIGFAGAEIFKGKDGRWDEKCDTMEQVPGKSLAWVDDNGALVIKENVFVPFVASVKETEYITTTAYAELCGRSVARVKKVCQDGRLPGAFKRGGQWFIPRDTPFPVDARFSGVEK